MTDEQLPPPPVPLDADLTNFAFTPIYRARLFGSAFHAKASDAEWRAGLTLWLKSQDQRPPGSLPDDDTELCRLAELGRDLKSWHRIKAGALHGWYRCSDGRLYHKTVAETVWEQWNSKLAQRQRTLKARIAACEKRLSQAAGERARADITEQLDALRQEMSQTLSQAARASVTEPVTDDVTATKGIEGKGIEGKGRDISSAHAQGDGQNVVPLKPVGQKRAGNPVDGLDAEMATWWGVYPRHKAKPAAEKAYRAARKKASAEILLAAARALRKAVDDGRVDPKFIPYPATWLNGERWLDEGEGGDGDGRADDVFAGAR